VAIATANQHHRKRERYNDAVHHTVILRALACPWQQRR
jgi:hypothetical protein